MSPFAAAAAKSSHVTFLTAVPRPQVVGRCQDEAQELAETQQEVPLAVRFKTNLLAAQSAAGPSSQNTDAVLPLLEGRRAGRGRSMT